MQYSEIRIRVRTQDVDTAGAIAGLVVPYGFYIEDYSDIEELAPQIAHIDLIEQELLERDRTHAVIHLYISPDENPAEAVSFLRERFDAAGIPTQSKQILLMRRTGRQPGKNITSRQKSASGL